MNNIVDFSVLNEGTIFLLTPHTDAAKEWASNNLPDEVQHFGAGIAIGHRYITPIVQGAQRDGLTVI